MRLTSLNKFVAVFLIGSLPLVWVFLRICDDTQRNFLSDYAFATGFAALIVAIFLGLAIDVLTDVFVRTPSETTWDHGRFAAWLRKPSTGCETILKWIAAWFWPQEEYRDYSVWRRRFKDIFERSSYALDEALQPSSDTQQGQTNLKNAGAFHITAAGIFLKHASRQQLDWLSATYANRILCSNLVVIITCIWVGEIVLSVLNKEPFTRVILILSVVPLVFLNLALLGRTLDNHFYSYMIALRFASLHCREKMRAPSQKARKGGR